MRPLQALLKKLCVSPHCRQYQPAPKAVEEEVTFGRSRRWGDHCICHRCQCRL